MLGLPRQHSQHPAHAAPSEDASSSAKHDDDADLHLPGVDTGMLKEIAKRALIDALNSVNGAKTLVLDPSLAGPLGLVTEVSLLKQHGVDKMFWLESGPLNAVTTNIVYLCRPQIKYMKIVAEHIKALSSSSSTTPHTYTLVLLPRRTALCDRVLEEEGVFGEITISAYKLEFIPLEDDLVSLEWESTFKEIFLDGDETSIYYAAQALITIQQAYGLFPRIVGKGDAAKKLANLLIHLRAHPADASQARNANLSTPSDILDSLIIVDRSTDMITPLLTPLTYEGLIDEYIGIKNSYIEIEVPSTTGASGPGTPSTSSGLAVTPAAGPKKKKQLLTTASDPLFGQLRDANFAVVGTKLSREAKRLETEYQGRHQAQTVAQLRDFVGKLGGLQNEHQSLGLHTELSEKIAAFTRTDLFNKGLEIQQNLLASYDPAGQIEAIDDLIAQQAPVQIVLRLLCLASITGGGIKAKVLDNLKREILQTYGYNLLPLLLSLTSLSLLLPNPLPKSMIAAATASSQSTSLKPPPLPSAFGPIRKSFRILSDTPEATPTDISYVYSGYAPLSVRMVQAVAMKGGVLGNLSLVQHAVEGGREPKVEKVAAHPITGWKGFEDAVKLLPGAVVDELQKGDVPGSTAGVKGERTTTTFVFFLGGCTYTEVAALRWMAKHNRGRRFVIGTTGMIGGSTLLESMAPAGVKFKSLSS